MRIPITMCHGVSEKLDAERFRQYFEIASDMGFESISYDGLAAWRAGEGDLPPRPIMFDFDHPSKSVRHEIHPIMEDLGFRGNLFVNTLPLEEMYSEALPDPDDRQWLTWEELGELADAGWLIGAHTHTHPNLSAMSTEDPSGDQLRGELEKNDAILEEKLGAAPKDFAFTGTSWSSAAEKEVKKRYRFGRLWIIGAMYEADGSPIRYADLVGIEGEDEADGGPPAAARYITEGSDPYRLASMELERLIYELDAYRRYLEESMEES